MLKNALFLAAAAPAVLASINDDVLGGAIFTDSQKPIQVTQGTQGAARAAGELRHVAPGRGRASKGENGAERNVY